MKNDSLKKICLNFKNMKYSRINKKCFSDSNYSILKSNINFDLKAVTFKEYEKIMEETIKNLNIMKKIGLKENLSNIEIQNETEPNIPQGLKDKIQNNYGKFSMPLGWGWAYPLIKYTSAGLVAIKVSLNIPWMSFFILTGISVRLLMLPLIIKQIISIQKMSKISPNMRLLLILTKDCNLPFRLKLYYYIKTCWNWCRDIKVNPIMFIAYNLFQIPIFFTIIFSIRKISFEQNLEGTGMLWFKNLNEADPYMILPIISVLITYYNLGVRFF